MAKHPRLKAGGLGAHLLGDIADLRVHIIEQPLRFDMMPAVRMPLIQSAMA